MATKATITLTVESHLQAEILCLLSRWIQGYKLEGREFERIKELVEFTDTIADGLVFVLRLEDEQGEQ